jgi:site-specific recombinase XerD
MAIKSLTDEELSMLMFFMSKEKIRERTKSRNLLISSLMALGGLRVGEVVRLRIMDLTTMTQPNTAIDITPQIAEKGCCRVVPLKQSTQELIFQAQKHVWRGLEPADFAFFTSSPKKPITTRQIERIIKSAGRQAIARDITPHTLRHTFATRLMRVTNTRVVQQLLGHKHLSSTEIYTHPNAQDCRTAQNLMPDIL